MEPRNKVPVEDLNVLLDQARDAEDLFAASFTALQESVAEAAEKGSTHVRFSTVHGSGAVQQRIVCYHEADESDEQYAERLKFEKAIEARRDASNLKRMFELAEEQGYTLTNKEDMDG